MYYDSDAPQQQEQLPCTQNSSCFSVWTCNDWFRIALQYRIWVLLHSHHTMLTFSFSVDASPGALPPVCHLVPPLLFPDYWAAGALLPSAVSPSTSTFTSSSLSTPLSSRPPFLFFYWSSLSLEHAYQCPREGFGLRKVKHFHMFFAINGTLWMWNLFLHVMGH